jgi:IS5 family transposase
VDVGSELIRRRTLTSANVHDSKEKDKLFVGDEQSKHDDSAYSCDDDKRQARKAGIFYGVLDKARRNQPLSNKQKKRNKRLSVIRAQVEHPFAFMYRHGYNQARAKSKAANQVHFDMNCILYNVRRAVFLLKRQACWT